MTTVARDRTKYSWSELLRLATARLTLNDRLLSRWRQTQDFESWAIAQEPHKLDGAVDNLVQLLYVAFCCGAGSQAAHVASAVSFTVKLAALQQLRRAGRIVLQVGLEFDMEDNRVFAERQAPVSRVSSTSRLSPRRWPQRDCVQARG